MKNRLIKKYSFGLFSLILLCSPFGCGKSKSGNSNQQTFNGRMERQAYLGTTRSTLYLNGYDRLPSVTGKGSFNIDKISGDHSTHKVCF